MSDVFLMRTSLADFEKKVKTLPPFLDKAGAFEHIKAKQLVGIKIHFGEEKNCSYIKPQYIKNVIERIKRMGAKPFIFDTNTLYRGKRTNSVDHFNLAYFEHNFKLLNIPVLFADGLKGNDYIEVDVGGKHFKKARIASLLNDLDYMLTFSHLTGHILAGFGATIKNLGMGCAARAGKMEQHCEIAPQVKQDICILCKRCIEVCPQHAVMQHDDKIFVDIGKCIGCAQCISECPKSAMKIVWSENYRLLQEKMVEYAKAAYDVCRHSFFVNFAMFVTKECDCMTKEVQGVVEDLGITASSDPLSIDKATVELLNQKNGTDIFAEIYPQTQYVHQFEYAHNLGLGSLDYRIREVVL